MAASLRDLRRKIKSTQSTKKITQAMQMMASSKMQKAIKSAEKSRDYSRVAWEIVENIKLRTDLTRHLLLSERPLKKVLIVLVTSNRGLCGGLNAQVLRKLNLYLDELKKSNISASLITIGNKGKLFVSRYLKDMLIADFPASDKAIDFANTQAMAKMILDDYALGKYDHVSIFYNHFASTLKQEPMQKQILPIAYLSKEENQQLSEQNNIKTEYKFEPDINYILDTMLPTIIKIQIHQILLEANASEHSARMIAMKNATDNASDLIDDLTLTYNSLRQAAITKEITEISAGAEALRS